MQSEKREGPPRSSDDVPHLNHLPIGEVLFSYPLLEQLAREAGAIKRKVRKVDPCQLLATLMGTCPHGSPSYNDLASQIENSHAYDPTKQAVALRFNPSFELFIETVLGHVIALKVNEDLQAGGLDLATFRGYRRVLVQDSTVIRLPSALFDDFSGVANASSAVCNARIQAVYDLISGRLISFSIDPYSKNDLSAAPELKLMPGDLVLRDRGYLTASEMQRHYDAGADFIYRHKTGVNYLDVATLQPIDLVALLKERDSLDMEVLLNNDRLTRVRLLAAPVSEETANMRRMRAKKEACGHNPSKVVLALMDWTIFLTSIPSGKADFQTILGIYGLRWRIEVIFKAWKSHLKFGVLHRVSKIQLQILLKTRLLIITAAARLYRPLESVLWRNYRRRLSLLKFMKYFASSPKHLQRVIDWTDINGTESATLEKALLRYCCYDKRTKRMNFNETWEALA